MIEAVLARTDEEIKAVRVGMPKLGIEKALCIYGYWDGNRCVGGSYLLANYPNELVLELHTYCPTVIRAIGQSFSEMLKIKPQLNARIKNTNYKSLKIAKMLGFKKLYNDDDLIVVQFNKENWRYKKRCPLT